MKAKIFTFAALIACLSSLTACHSKTEVASTYAYTSLETVCLNQNLDSTLTVRAWGRGTNKGDAIEQAKKNAIAKVLFEGFSSGVKGDDRLPLVMEVNGRERYDYYFAPFFKDGGTYRKFVKENDGTRASRIESSGKSMTGYGVVLDIDRKALRERLIKDGILKP